MYDDLVNRLHIYSEACVAYKLDADFASAVQEAADAIEELTGFVQEAERDRDEYRERLDKANDTIEDLEFACNRYEKDYKALCEYLPKWTPVTERLPKIDEKHHCSKDVLAYLDGGGMCFTALEENIFGQTWFECERHPALEEEMIVTHWMKLPEPPDHIGESTEMVDKLDDEQYRVEQKELWDSIQKRSKSTGVNIHDLLEPQKESES